MILLESRRVKFQVQYPNAPRHDVELPGTVAILGRDPSCDLVLNDVKCSRRHAVMEAGPQGLSVRDTGSANGVFINGKKVDRSSLKDGDVVRLGDVTLTVLPDEMPGTLVMGPEELQEATAVAPVLPAPRVPNAAQRKTETVPPRPRTLIPPRAPAETHRPLTLTVLAMLWLISVLVYPAAGLLTARATGGTTAAVAVVVAVALAALSGGMAFGLWKRRPWARAAQIAVASVGLLLCPFTLASAAVLAYMLRPVTASHFSGTRPGEPLRPDAAEMTFTGLIMATVLLGTILAAGLVFFFRPSFGYPGGY
jgi:hypothetical protein